MHRGNEHGISPRHWRLKALFLLRLVWACAAFWGVLLLVLLMLTWVESGVKALLWSGGMLSVTGTLLFAVLPILICGNYHVWCVRRIAGRLRAEDLSVVQRRCIETTLSRVAALDLCLSALGRIPQSEVLSIDRVRGHISAKTGISWKSFGESISFDIVEHGSGGSEITVVSRPRVRTVVVDAGKSLENVLVMARFLEGQSPGQ